MFAQSGGNLYTSSSIVGVVGIGLFNQSGGLHAVNGTLNVGQYTSATTTYGLSGGTLTALAAAVGPTTNLLPGSLPYTPDGPYRGTFAQTGGTFNVAGDLDLATLPASTACTAGPARPRPPKCRPPPCAWASAGRPRSTRAGGTNTVTDDLSVGVNAGALGGHKITVGTLTVGPSGTYNLVAGQAGFPPTLRAGTIAVQNGCGSLLVDGGILRPSTDNASGISGQNVSIGANGMSVLADGRNVAISSGLLHGAALGTARDGGLGVGDGTGNPGVGSLTLTGTAFYTGDTRVAQGATLYYNAFSLTGSGSKAVRERGPARRHGQHRQPRSDRH